MDREGNRELDNNETFLSVTMPVFGFFSLLLSSTYAYKRLHATEWSVYCVCFARVWEWVLPYQARPIWCALYLHYPAVGEAAGRERERAGQVMASRGIIYEYEDGGRYCGEWENDTAHGHGVCTGPNGNGLFQGLWERGHQSSGVFTWPSGQRYMGKWRQGVREGVGKETKTDGTEYCGEFTGDSRGPFGVLRQPNGVLYRGTWKDGVQNGLGTELYIDGGEHSLCVSAEM